MPNSSPSAPNACGTAIEATSIPARPRAAPRAPRPSSLPAVFPSQAYALHTHQATARIARPSTRRGPGRVVRRRTP